jgi:hypothetical protein
LKVWVERFPKTIISITCWSQFIDSLFCELISTIIVTPKERMCLLSKKDTLPWEMPWIRQVLLSTEFFFFLSVEFGHWLLLFFEVVQFFSLFVSGDSTVHGVGLQYISQLKTTTLGSS